MKTNKINVVLSLNKTVVVRLNDGDLFEPLSTDACGTGGRTIKVTKIVTISNYYPCNTIYSPPNGCHDSDQCTMGMNCLP